MPTGPLENQSSALAALIEQCYSLERAGDISGALRQARLACEQARATGTAGDLAASLTCLAHCHHHLGHFDRAAELAQEALALAGAESRSRADALRILGSCAHEAGDLTAAETYYHRAIDLARQEGYHEAVQSCLHSLSACVYIPRGQFDLALAADEESLRLALELGLTEIAWFPLATMGWNYWVTGRRACALAVADELRDYAAPGSMAEGYYYCLCADLAQESETPDAALALYSRARTIAEIIGDPGLHAELRVGLSRFYRTAGNVAAAHSWADDAYAIARRAGSRDLQAWALIERARAAWAGADLVQAEADLTAAGSIVAPMEAGYDLARVSFFLAALLHRQERPSGKEHWLEAATRIAAGGYAFLLERERRLAFPLLADYQHSDDPELAELSARLLDHLARVPPRPLQIHGLGRFHVRQGQRAIPAQAWRRRRAGELFRFLLLSTGRSATRERVLEAFWPGKSPSSAQALFHRATSALRHVLEPDLPDKFPSRYLLVDGGEITLVLPDESWVDFEAFEQSVANQDWERALDIYRGDLFPEDIYADWSTARRERLKQQATRTALALAREALAAGQPEKAANASRRAMALEPWQEEAVLLGMEACMALNDRAGAIRLYQKLERTLRDELDIKPQEAVRAYYTTLLNR